MTLFTVISCKQAIRGTSDPKSPQATTTPLGKATLPATNGTVPAMKPISKQNTSVAPVPIPPAPKPSSSWTKIACGESSYYGADFAGSPTASGEPFNPGALTAAHKTLPFNLQVRVVPEGKDPDSQPQVTVKINDRGPFVSGRIIDLSEKAFDVLFDTGSGTGHVCLYKSAR